MILFVSDLHFGRSDLATEHAHERDLMACLRAYEERLTALYLLGDLYDAYIEYEHTVPKGLARLQGLLAAWTDRGIPVIYYVGNHDPWHRDYYASELGIEVVTDGRTEELQGMAIYLHHGDGHTRGTAYRWLKPVLRHPIPVWCYRNLLPGDLGMRLAQWTKGTMGTDAVEASVIESLRQHAQTVLRTTDATHVVMAHSHYPEHVTWPVGTYLNTGSWRFSRSFATLDDGIFALHQWNGQRAVRITPTMHVTTPPAQAPPLPAPQPAPQTKYSHDV